LAAKSAAQQESFKEERHKANEEESANHEASQKEEVDGILGSQQNRLILSLLRPALI